MIKDNLILALGDLDKPHEWLQILPLGKVELRDTRAPVVVNQEDLQAIIAKYREGGVDLVVDYEHQSLVGERAPAAGWIKDMEARPQGLYARVEWNQAALKFIMAKEYRYYSPVMRLSPERHPTELMHVGLTNVPAIKGLAPLLAAKYGGDGGEPEIIRLSSQVSPAPNKHEEAAMLKRLIEKLGLKPEATEEEVLALVASRAQEVVALKAQAAALPQIAEVLALKADASASEIIGTIKGLKDNQDRLATVETELTALKQAQAQGEAEAAVDAAIAAKKITPAMREIKLKQAMRDLAEFKAEMAVAPVVGPAEPLKVKTADGKGEISLTPDELTVCKAMGVTPEAFKAEKDKQATA